MTKSFIVLQSFPTPRSTTNPYLIMLAESLARVPSVLVKNFSWPTALFTRYDVFHVHWPEILVSGHTPLKKLARQLLFCTLLVRLRLLGTPIVRTVHNIELPDGISRGEVALLQIFNRQTCLRIRINATTEIPPGQPSATILHGHYRTWFAKYPRPESVPGQVGYIGLIRRYKGVDGLLKAFKQIQPDSLAATLHIAGKPSSEEIAEEMRALAAGDDRIRLSLHFLTDAELAEEVSKAELMVLPYKEMHNSGGVLAALSLDRPVLVPDNEANRRLAAEVGPGWIHRYQGELMGQDIENAIGSIRSTPPEHEPDLSARDWRQTGQDHVTAYGTARSLTRRWPRSLLN